MLKRNLRNIYLNEISESLNLVNYNEKELSEDDIYIENHCRLYNTIIVLKQMA